MEAKKVDAQEVVETTPAAEPAPAVEAPAPEVAAPNPEVAAPESAAAKPAEETEVKETPAEEKETAEAAAAAPAKVEEEFLEEEEEEEEEVPDEEWVSDEEPAMRKRGRRAMMSADDDDDDEEYGRAKKRRVVPAKKPVRRNVTANEPAGMKALRDYTSALKLGPRCFRNLNKITNMKDREAELIRRLHENGRQWEGEYPSPNEIEAAKEETRQKKAEKAKQYILEEDVSGVRVARKAAQKARDFVKTLGEESDNDVNDEEVEAAAIEDDGKDEE